MTWDDGPECYGMVLKTWRDDSDLAAELPGTPTNKASVAASGKFGLHTLKLAIEKEFGSLDLKALTSQT